MIDNPDDDRDQRLDAWLRAGADDLAAAVAAHVDLPGTLAEVTVRARQRPGSPVRIPAQRSLPTQSGVAAVAHAAAISWAPGDVLRRRIFVSIGAALVLLTLVLIAAYSSGAPPAVIPPPDRMPTVSTPVESDGATQPLPAPGR